MGGDTLRPVGFRVMILFVIQQVTFIHLLIINPVKHKMHSHLLKLVVYRAQLNKTQHKAFFKNA